MIVKLSEVKTPEYTTCYGAWDEYRKIGVDPADMLDELPAVAEEEFENLEARRNLAVDVANLPQAIQNQLDIITLPGFEVILTFDNPEFGKMFVDANGGKKSA